MPQSVLDELAAILDQMDKMLSEESEVLHKMHRMRSAKETQLQALKHKVTMLRTKILVSGSSNESST